MARADGRGVELNRAIESRNRPRRDRMHRSDGGHGVALSEFEVATHAAAVALRLPIEERENDRHVLT